MWSRAAWLVGWLLLVLWAAASCQGVEFDVSQWPESGTPPSYRCGYCVVYQESPSRSFYVIDGQDDYSQFQGGIFRFDIEAATWSLYPVVGRKPEPRSYLTCHMVDDHLIYQFGGEGASGVHDELWVFNTRTLKYKEIITSGTESPPARVYGSFFALPGLPSHLYIHGGLNPLGELSDTWAYDLNDHSWTEVATTGFPQGLYREGTFMATGPLTAVLLPGGNEVPSVVYEAVFDGTGMSALLTALPVASVAEPVSRYAAARYMYNGKVYLSHGWSDAYSVSFGDFWAYDLVTHEWESFAVFPDWRDSLLPLQVGNLVYYFGGWGEVIHNDMYVLDLDTLMLTQLHTDYTAPLPQSYHASAVLGTYLYTFGGQSSSGLRSDLWRLDMETREWELVVPRGTAPPPRHSTMMVSVGRRIIIFGGTNDSGPLSDVHVYNTLTSTWSEAPVSAESVAARTGHFGVLLPGTAYIFVSGGAGEGGDFEEDILFNHLTNTFLALNTTGSPTPGSYKGACWVEDRIIVVGGTNSGYNLDEVWAVRVDVGAMTSQWDYLGAALHTGIAFNVVSLGRYVVVAGGMFYDVLLKELNVYEVTGSGTFEHVATLSNDTVWESFGASSTGLFGSSLVLYGGSGRASTDSNNILAGFHGNSVYKFELSPVCSAAASVVGSSTEGGAPCFPCSPGTLVSQVDGSGEPTCEPCPSGTYSSEFGVSDCTPCPAGYYSSLSGASSSSSCVPCPPDTYGDSAGLGECYPCPEDKVCTFATIVPGSRIDSEVFFEDQPGEANDSAAERINYALTMLALVAGGALVVVLLLFALTMKRCVSKWQLLDVVYSLSHYVASEGRALKKQRTALGGLFTVLLLIGIPFMCGYVLLPVSIQNTAEARTVIPNILVASRTIYTEINAVFSLNGYLGGCEGGPLSGNPSLRACVSGLAGSHPGITSGRSESWSCRQAALDVCEVSYYCEACVLSSPNTEIRLDVSTDNSYASSIGWFLNTTAAMPARYSISRNIINPEPGAIFRGTAEENRVRFSVVPVIYHVVFNATYVTGVIASFLDETRGSQVTSNSFHSANGFEFVMSFEKTTTTLNVDVDNQLKVTVVLAAILGAISAVVGGGAFVLKQTERALSLKGARGGSAVQVATGVISPRVMEEDTARSSSLSEARYRHGATTMQSVVLGLGASGRLTQVQEGHQAHTQSHPRTHDGDLSKSGGVRNGGDGRDGGGATENDRGDGRRLRGRGSSSSSRGSSLSGSSSDSESRMRSRDIDGHHGARDGGDREGQSRVAVPIAAVSGGGIARGPPGAQVPPRKENNNNNNNNNNNGDTVVVALNIAKPSRDPPSHKSKTAVFSSLSDVADEEAAAVPGRVK